LGTGSAIVGKQAGGKLASYSTNGTLKAGLTFFGSNFSLGAIAEGFEEENEEPGGSGESSKRWGRVMCVRSCMAAARRGFGGGSGGGKELVCLVRLMRFRCSVD